jgi:hypothetical protein
MPAARYDYGLNGAAMKPDDLYSTAHSRLGSTEQPPARERPGFLARIRRHVEANAEATAETERDFHRHRRETLSSARRDKCDDCLEKAITACDTALRAEWNRAADDDTLLVTIHKNRRGKGFQLIIAEHTTPENYRARSDQTAPVLGQLLRHPHLSLKMVHGITECTSLKHGSVFEAKNLKTLTTAVREAVSPENQKYFDDISADAAHMR